MPRSLGSFIRTRLGLLRSRLAAECFFSSRLHHRNTRLISQRIVVLRRLRELFISTTGVCSFPSRIRRLADRYYFFNIDAAKIDFGEPIKASGEAAKDPLELILGNWRFDLESTEAEVYKFEKEEIRKILSGMVEVFRDSEMVIRRDRIRMYMPSKEVRSDEQYEVIEQSDKGFVLRLTEPALKTTRDWDVKVDVEGRLQVGTKSPQLKGFTFFYVRW